MSEKELGGGVEGLEREAEVLIRNSLKRLEKEYDKEGKGDAWFYEEPRYHFWKACDELFSATHHSKENDLKEMYKCTKDAINHIVMAIRVARYNSDSRVLIP